MFKRAIAIDEKSLPPDHPALASHLSNLANLYNSQGNYSEAEPLFKRAIAIAEKSLPPDHPNLARDLGNLALLYYNQGNYTEAELLYLRVLEIRVQKLGTEHPETQFSWECLMIVWGVMINEIGRTKLEELNEYPFGAVFLGKIGIQTEN